MLSQDYYGFTINSKKPSSRHIIHRTQLSEQKLSNNKSSREKQSIDDQRLEKLKQKYNQINNSNTANRLKDLSRSKDRPGDRSRQRSRKNKFQNPHKYVDPSIKLRTFHYNDQGTFGGYNEMRRRVEKKAMEAVDRNFTGRFNIREGKQCVSESHIRQAQEFLNRRSRNNYLGDGLKTDRNDYHHHKSLSNADLRSSSNSHRNLRRMKPEEKQRLSFQKDLSQEMSIQNQRVTVSKESKQILSYSQKQSMLLGTQTIKKYKQVNEIAPTLSPNRQNFDESVISINSKQQKGSDISLSVVRSSDQLPKNPILATSDYELIKELQKRAKAEESQTEKQYNKMEPLPSDLKQENNYRSSQNNNICESQANSNTLSKVIKNSSDIMKKTINDGQNSSKNSRFSVTYRESTYKSVTNRESNGSNLGLIIQQQKVIKEFQKQISIQKPNYDKRKPIQADQYEQFLNTMSKANYEQSPNSSLNISKSIQLSYPAYQQQQVYEPSSSVHNSIHIDPYVPQLQASSQPHFIVAPLAQETQNIGISGGVNFDKVAEQLAEKCLVQSQRSFQKEESCNLKENNDLKGEDTFSFVLNQLPSEPQPRRLPVPYEQDLPHFGSYSSIPNQQKGQHSLVLHDNSPSNSSINEFLPKEPSRPSVQASSYNVLQAIHEINAEEQKRICSLYSSFGFEDEGLQNFMDRLYDHLASVNKIIDFVGDTEVFYVDKSQKQMFQTCSYLLTKRLLEQKIKIASCLQIRRSCFNLVGKQIPESEINRYAKTEGVHQFISNLNSSNQKIRQIVYGLYNKLKLMHSSIPKPQNSITQQDIFTIFQKFNEQLELLIQKIDDNAHMSQSNSYIRDNEYEAISMRAFAIMELAFLISALEGRNVKKVQSIIEPEDFEMYCKNNYGLFQETVLYFH